MIFYAEYTCKLCCKTIESKHAQEKLGLNKTDEYSITSYLILVIVHHPSQKHRAKLKMESFSKNVN